MGDRRRGIIANNSSTEAKGIELKGIISKDPAMLRIFGLIEKLAKTDCPVLIMGESGTGKELIARAIHYNSPRRSQPFLPVNCGALPESLLESELFGHEKGAFTGALSSRKGLFEEANGGTLFLDEIGETSPFLQVKLLRALQDGEIRRIGAEKNIKVDVRIISATNKDLRAAVERKEFRDDLYYRLNVAQIYIPPLRERVDDIPFLVDYFLKRASNKLNKPIKGISKEVMEKLIRYSWPGNVRELENLIETAVIFATPPIIKLQDIPTLQEKVALHSRKTRLIDIPFYKAREMFEKEYISNLLKRTNNNISMASEIAKVDRKTIRIMARRYGLL
jgi:transcriptional regulator with PAS, ATPase and Fis domain